MIHTKRHFMLPVLIVILFSLNNRICGQVNEMTLDSDHSIEVLNFLDLGQNGFAIKTGKPRITSKKANWVIHRYAPNMDLLWKVNIENDRAEKGFEHHMIASPSGNYLYSIEPQGYNTTIGSGKYHITQIKNHLLGPTTTLDEIPSPRRLIHAFANDTYLYFLGTKKGNETYAKLKADESLFLSKVSHDDLAFNYIQLDLPKLTDPKRSTFWSYVGHSEEAFYVCSKRINPEEGKYTYAVRKFDLNGNFMSDFDLELGLGKMHIVPSNNEKNNAGSLILSENDYQSSASGPSEVIKYTPYLGAFGNIQFDFKNENIYVYGSYSDEPYSRSKITYSGFFITKYKITGEIIWTKLFDFCDLLTEDKYFPKTSYNFFIGHNTSLTFLPEEELELKFWFKKIVCCHKLSPNGEVISGQETTFKTILRDDKHKLCSADANREQVLNYILSKSKGEFRNREFQYYSYQSNAVILEFNEFSKSINLKHFNENH